MVRWPFPLSRRRRVPPYSQTCVASTGHGWASVGLRRDVTERHVEKGDVRVLQLQPLFANGKRTVADGEQLFLIEVQLALVVHRPLEFAGHPERIHGTGIDAHPAEQ